MTGHVGLAAILAGTLANLIDRAADGVVTDYLHTGWFPTFNLADTLMGLLQGWVTSDLWCCGRRWKDVHHVEAVSQRVS